MLANNEILKPDWLFAAMSKALVGQCVSIITKAVQLERQIMLFSHGSNLLPGPYMDLDVAHSCFV